MFSRKSFPSWCFTLLLGGWAIVPAATGQGTGADTRSPSPAADTANNLLDNGLRIPSVFPIALPKNLVSRFSVGESYEDGILNGRYTDGSDVFTEASASFVYNLKRKRTEYAIDYRGSARHYRRHSNLDVLSHDLGVNQVRQLTARLTWNWNYRYSLTPDFSGDLLRDSLLRELSFVNALPTVNPIGLTANPSPNNLSVVREPFVNPLPGGMTLLPTTVDTLPEALTPGAGLLLVRSLRMMNHADTALNYALNSRASLFSQLRFQRTRYADANLLAMNDYSLSAGVRHSLSPRTDVGLSYQGGRNVLPFRRDQWTSHGLVVSLNRQLTPTTFLMLAGGPMRSIHQGQEEIALPSLLSNLLGRKSFHRDVSQSTLSWMGSMGIGTQWHGMRLDFKYSRLVSSTYGLGSASLQQHYSATVTRQLSRGTSLSTAASYMQSAFLGMRDPLRLNQRAFHGTLTHRLRTDLDFDVFFNYSKFRTGLRNPFPLNHSQFGIRFQYHLPRVGVM